MVHKRAAVKFLKYEGKSIILFKKLIELLWVKKM